MMNDTVYKYFKQRAIELSDEIIAWRHHLHQHPELSYKEVNTSEFIVQKLREFGYDTIQTGFGPLTTGVMTDVGSKGETIVALRGDIDALPINETANISCRSQIAGVMHACGHDAHTAILLAAARLLKEQESSLPGRVRLIFQPGEETRITHFEKPLSGASYVLRSGALEGVSSIFGLHVWSGLSAGKLFITEGPTMMASARFNLKILGQGCHGAAPHMGRDPIVAASQIIVALQSLVARELSLLHPGLISIGSIHGGTATNIIPQSLELSGTIRAASIDVVQFLGQRLGELAQNIAQALRCDTEYDLLINGDAVVNDPYAVQTVREAASQILGTDRVCPVEMLPASEDFREYTSRMPAALFFMGMNDPEQGTDVAHHDANFKVNDQVLADAAAVMAATAWRYLEKQVEHQ